MDHRVNAEVILETLDLADRVVIDIGCGDGGLARRMAEQGARVVGIECSPRQLARARRATPTEGATLVAGLGECLPVATAAADIAVFFNSLHHVPIALQSQALDEAARVLRPGGLVYISEPLAEGAHFTVARELDDETEVRAAALAAIHAATARAFDPVSEFRYIHTVRMASFEAWRERMSAIAPGRDALFQSLDIPLRARFAALATRDAEGGHGFDQPMRVNLLRRREGFPAAGRV